MIRRLALVLVAVLALTQTTSAAQIPTWDDAWWGTSPILGDVSTTTLLENKSRANYKKLEESLRRLEYTKPVADAMINAAQQGKCLLSILRVGSQFRTVNGQLAVSLWYLLDKELPIWDCAGIGIAIVCGNPVQVRAPAVAPAPVATPAPTPTATPTATPTPTPSPTPIPPGLAEATPRPPIEAATHHKKKFPWWVIPLLGLLIGVAVSGGDSESPPPDPFKPPETPGGEHK